MRGQAILPGDDEDAQADDDADNRSCGDPIGEKGELFFDLFSFVPGENLEDIGGEVHQRGGDCGAENNTSCHQLHIAVILSGVCNNSQGGRKGAVEERKVVQVQISNSKKN